jgi:hypothetical protein
VPHEAAMERAAGERWDGLTEAAEDVIQRQQGAAAELDDGSKHCFEPSSASVRTELRGRRGPIGASAVPVRPRHFATVFGFRL